MIRPPLKTLIDPPVAIIAIGSNLGDSARLVRRAIEKLQSLSVAPLVPSRLWRTEAEGCPAGTPDFVNAVVALEPHPDETPGSLFARLRQIETEFGRPPQREKNAPRTLDLDLIAFGNVIMNTPELVLPHPRAHKRRFVLGPLAEIAPELVLPGQTLTVLELWNRL